MEMTNNKTLIKCKIEGSRATLFYRSNLLPRKGEKIKDGDSILLVKDVIYDIENPDTYTILVKTLY